MNILLGIKFYDLFYEKKNCKKNIWKFEWKRRKLCEVRDKKKEIYPHVQIY